MGVEMDVFWLVLGLLQVSASSALQWTNPAELADDITIATCSGQDVTLAWKYTVPADEHVTDIEWHFIPDGSHTSQFLGTQVTQVSNHFLKDPEVTQNIQFIPNAGIRLLNVKAEHSGTYLVQVHLNHHGMIETYNQSITLVVTAVSLTTDGQLHAGTQQTAVYLNSTHQYHLLLTCGTFESLWLPRVNVIWTTPTNQTLQSTSQERGQFLLAVPNPVIPGGYTCMVDNSSAASLCIQGQSPLARGATVSVDGVAARLTLTETRMQVMAEQIKDLQTDKLRLEEQVQSLQTNVAKLEDHIHFVEGRVGVRLVNGNNFNEGRVEVWNGSTWGTVCDDYWDWPDAAVVCRQLGLPSDNIIPWGGATFGKGEGPILMDDVRCTGSENSLFDCFIPGSGCGHYEDAGVTCGGPPLEVRLVNGSDSQEGRLELRVNGTWSSVCYTTYWDSADAKVFCRQLGLPSGSSSVQLGSFGQGTGQVLGLYANCLGTENTFLDCPLYEGFYHCNALGSDIGIVCG